MISALDTLIPSLPFVPLEPSLPFAPTTIPRLATALSEKVKTNSPLELISDFTILIPSIPLAPSLPSTPFIPSFPFLPSSPLVPSLPFAPTTTPRLELCPFEYVKTNSPSEFISEFVMLTPSAPFIPTTLSRLTVFPSEKLRTS